LSFVLSIFKFEEKRHYNKKKGLLVAYSKETWEKIKSDFEQGMGLQELESKYGIKANSIGKKAKRELWVVLQKDTSNDDNSSPKKRSVFNEGWSPLEMLQKDKEDSSREGTVLRLVKNALLASAAGETATIEEFYDNEGNLKYTKVMKRPPSPTALNQLVMLDERIGLLSIDRNDYETEEEREARYLAYRAKVEKERKYYENRDIDKELEELGRAKEVNSFHITDFLRKEDNGVN
jgi:hypothetical protein